MELIPIIKYALTVISGISVIAIVGSYIGYKIKNGTNSSRGKQVMPEVNAVYYKPATVPPVNKFKKTVFVNKGKNISVHEKKIVHKKPVETKNIERFKIINDLPEYKDEKSSSHSGSFVFRNPYTQKGFNS